MSNQPSSSIADLIKAWEMLLVALDANAPELAYLDEYRAQLAGAWEGVKTAVARQAVHKALSQQATRDIEVNLEVGREMASRLRSGIRIRYGIKAEKLAEFGIQPRRPVDRSKSEAKKKPSEMGPNPAQTAAPVTDAST